MPPVSRGANCIVLSVGILFLLLICFLISSHSVKLVVVVMSVTKMLSSWRLLAVVVDKWSWCPTMSFVHTRHALGSTKPTFMNWLPVSFVAWENFALEQVPDGMCMCWVPILTHSQ